MYSDSYLVSRKKIDLYVYVYLTRPFLFNITTMYSNLYMYMYALTLYFLFNITTIILFY